MPTAPRFQGVFFAASLAAHSFGCGAGGKDRLCGNGVIDAGELCDRTALGGHDCSDVPGVPGVGGTLACAASCLAFDTSSCTGGTAWSCAASHYGTGDGCDCGCGLPDPDCVSATVASCDRCDDAGSCALGTCPWTIDPLANATCGWTCDPTYYADGLDCDCGCGLLDPDCVDSTVASCDFCDLTGSCSTSACPGSNASADNAVCI